MKKTFLALLSALLLVCPGCDFSLSAPGPVSIPADGETLSVHFLDVGQADAALLQCGGQTMLIDGGNVADSSLVVSYLEDQGVDTLDYLLCTHAHEDHVGGLSGPLNTVTVNAVYAPVTEYDSKAFRDFVKYTQAQGLSIQVPQAGDSLPLGDAQITILGPVRDYEETNDTSIVLRVDFGQTSFLFTGDMERAAEQDLIDSGAQLSADVLKVGHHGSDTSTSYVFLREVLPDYAVISVGEGNSYGHPTDTVLSRLRDAEAAVYRTDLQGTVSAVSDGSSITFTTQRGETIQTVPAGEPTADRYIGNISSKKLHTPDCPNLPREENQIIFDDYADAIDGGYTPCGNCLGK